MTKPQAASPSPRIMAAAAAAANQDAVQPEGSPMRAISVCSDESCHASMVKKALSRAQRENRRLQRRVRYPALALGFLLMAGSMYLAFTSWTSQAQLTLLVRDLLRSLGFISWLCACLPSDRWAPKVGSLLLIILGVKCLIWNTQKVAVYAHQLTDHLEAGQKCHIENEEVDCFLGAYIIGTTSLTYVVMRVWQLPYLAYGLILPSRATMGRLWVGLALPHLAEGITALIAVLPSMVVKMRMGKAICSDMVLCTSLRGVYGLMSGILLMLPGFRRWVHFRLLAASGAFTAAGSIAAFLGSRSAAKVMEVARNTCRYVTLDKVTKQDLMNSSPDSALKRLSVPCHLPDIDAFLSHSWHDSATNKWEALQAWRKSFKSQHKREPRLWIDKYCIDQENIDASLMCLPVFLASCHTLLIIAGESYFDRLWCLEEVFIYLQLSRSRDTIEMLPLCNDLDERIRTFDAEVAQCVKACDRQKLLATIEAGCGDYKTFNADVQDALSYALKKSRWATPA
ncbi:unnamed protein product [Symbiodinium sp. CCMP2456]|nr:unnamed protein product [Symbiodinium sp. CCMP2456]